MRAKIRHMNLSANLLPKFFTPPSSPSTLWEGWGGGYCEWKGFMNIAFFASHRGSDMQAVIDACKDGRLNARPAPSSATTAIPERWNGRDGKAFLHII